MINILIKAVNKVSLILFQKWNLLKLRTLPKTRVRLTDKGRGYRLIGSFYLRMKKSAKLEIGKNLTISSGLCYNPICRNIRTAFFIEDGANIVIGDNVGISGACLWAHQSITVGNNVKIGGDSVLIDSDCHSLDPIIRASEEDQNRKVNKPIEIGDDVLIGARSIILKGVKIGDRSIIGAGSVVTKSIPQDEVWAGNPAKFVKKIIKNV